ncbi:MAG: NADH-ubiquinone oxidoreductase-F iron-sulfur binding region domain-containing protein [Acidobacteriota bacterium]
MEKVLTKDVPADGSALDIQGYEKAGGYQGLRKALKMAPNEVVEVVKQSNLRGRGGAGFPTGLKWSFVPRGAGAPHPKYLCANADEMEPGTFKDRLLMESTPHQLIEGMICAAYAIEADVAYIFLRGEYFLSAERLRKALAEAYAKNYLGKNILGSGYSLEMHLHLSGGRYMCGEETGLLNALEGKRANPRTKPPFPQISGLFGKPSIVQNIETLCNIHHIINNGPEWFKGLSKSADAGTKLYGASGKVKRPGLWELPMGTTVREILEEHAGGMKEGLKFRGLLPGGASTDFTCPVGFVQNLEHFFAQESCGWCTPCWSGLSWAEKMLQSIEDGQGQESDLERLAFICRFAGPGNTFCALAPGAVEPLQSALKYFREDFERHIREKRCPWR